MSDCPATDTITLDGQQITVICNLPPHRDEQHHDNVHGDWPERLDQTVI